MHVVNFLALSSRIRTVELKTGVCKKTGSEILHNLQPVNYVAVVVTLQ